jgi:hypothetical protein
MAPRIITRMRPRRGEHNLASFLFTELSRRRDKGFEPNLGRPYLGSEFYHPTLLRILRGEQQHTVAVIEERDPNKIILRGKDYQGSLEPHIEELKEILRRFKTKETILIEIWE